MTFTPAESEALFRNPGKGWTFYYWDHGMRENYNGRLKGPDDHLEDIPGLGVVYLRFAWSYLEPEEGGFRWNVLDRVMDDWYAHGRQIALRITCVDSVAQITYEETGYSTPKWVRDAGARGYDYSSADGSGKPMWEPKYDDPVFLAKLDNLLSALGQRYNGSDKIAWIDVGSLGTWGEGHIGYASGKNPYSVDTGRRHLDMHIRHFPDTLLLINDDHPDPLKDYAREKGFGIRDDSVKPPPGPGDGRPKADVAQFWQTRPAICETYHYAHMKDGFGYSVDQIKDTIRDYVVNNHSSHVSIHGWPREFMEDVGPAYMEEITRKMGYRFVIREVTVQGPVVPGRKLDVILKVENKGVAPCYAGYRVALALSPADGGPEIRLVAEHSDARDWAAGMTTERVYTFHAPASRPEGDWSPGPYQLAVGLVAPDGSELEGVVSFANEGGRSDRYCLLGTVQVNTQSVELE